MTKGSFIHRKTCRLCKSNKLTKFLDLGWMPLAGDFLTKNHVGKEKYYPLRIYFCHNCSLIQVSDVVSSKELFSDYRYLSSATQTLRNHFENLAKITFKRFLKPGDVTVEIGSNDGVLQTPLKKLGVVPIGVDPAKNVVKQIFVQNLPVINDFFTEKIAGKILKKYGPIKVVFASNVFAHVDNLDDIVSGVLKLIHDNGVFIIEVHYLFDLLEKLQYDTIYQEHVCYFSLTTLDRYFISQGLKIWDVERIPIHAGSIRIFVSPTKKQAPNF